jgi:hypothetical protein
MSPALMYAANAVTILLLVFGIFLPRHGRRELVGRETSGRAGPAEGTRQPTA